MRTECRAQGLSAITVTPVIHSTKGRSKGYEAVSQEANKKLGALT